MTFIPIEEPFWNKGVLPPGASDFYERPELYTKIEKSLQEGMSVSLVGERKAGKTSFLNYLSFHLPEDKFITVFIDAQMAQSDKDFLRLLITKSVARIKTQTGATITVPVDPYTVPDNQVYPSFSKNLEAIIDALPQTSYRLIWLIDEIEHLQRFKDTNLFSFLRPLAEYNPDVCLVVAGYDVLYELAVNSSWPVFYSAFKSLHLRKLSKNTAQQLISDATEKMGSNVTLQANVNDQILKWTGQKPFFLKWVMSKIAEALNRQKTDYEVNQDVLIKAKTLFLDENNLHDYFNYWWDVHTSPHQQRLLFLMSSENIPYNNSKIHEKLKEKMQATDYNIQNLRDDLKRLEQLGFLYEQNGSYSFSSGCLKDWLTQ